jgi:oligopeptidase B
MTHFLTIAPPEPVERRTSLSVVHGVTIDDPYAWLRADNWQEVLRDPAALDPAIRAVLDRENAFADAMLAPTKALQSRLKREMRGRMEEEDSEVPVPDGPFDYYGRHREDGQHQIVCRRPRGGGPEQILLDGDAEAGDAAFFDLGDAEHSPDHARLAWSVDEKGSELYTIRIRDLSSGADLPDIVPDTEGTAVWFADGRSFLYVRMDENHRASRVFRHVLGTNVSADTLVLDEPDPGWFVSIGGSRSGDVAVISIHGHDASESHLVDLRQGEGRPRRVAAREPGLRYAVDQRGDSLFILTNADGAEDFKIVVAPREADDRAAWRDLVAHRPGRLILDVVVFADFMVRLEREDGLPRLVIRAEADAAEHAIAFDEAAYSLGLEAMREQASTILRFAYSSMSTPEEVFDYDMAARTRVLRKRRLVPSGHTPADYVTNRIFATAPDGARVPISLLHRRDTPLDGTAPLLLYGYGAYGHAIPAAFGSNRLSLVDRGFVFAIAHVRGGTDKGWAWYTDGKLQNKPNTFGDFIAAGRFLVAERYTSVGRIVAQGGSAGGMLMGAIANRAPDLFAGIIADVPFVDVLTTMLDAELPLTPPEWLEWGNPILDRAAFDTIRAYSPYDNVAERAYPPILALGGLTDPRVTYWEPAKWVARLRERMTGGGPVLLKTNMEAGHGGASGRFDRLDEVAMEQAFALVCVGLAG